MLFPTEQALGQTPALPKAMLLRLFCRNDRRKNAPGFLAGVPWHSHGFPHISEPKSYQ
jgi:hypothetical protein